MQKSSFISKLLDNLLPPDLHHLIGDLEEEFHYNCEADGITSARIRFWWQLFRSAPWLILQSLIWNTEMLHNYLKVTWRNIRKHSSFSFINIFGLAASMSICLLIILFLTDQFSYDRFHDNNDRIVRVISDFQSPYNNESTLYATSPAPLTDILLERFPEVEKAAHIKGRLGEEFRYGDKVLPLEGIYADRVFLEMFGFDLVSGDAETALSKPGNIILTTDAAQKMFGDEDPMGKVLTALGDIDYTVTGVMKVKKQTHFQFEVIGSYSTLTSDPDEQAILDNWVNSIYDSYTYILLNENTDFDEFEARLQPIIQSDFVDENGESGLLHLSVQPLNKINLGPALSNEVGIVMPGFIAWFLTGFAVIIMLIASFNYVSLTVARSLNRGKEVGVRKVLGAFRLSVIKQFLFESVIISLLALLFSGLLLRWLLPEFNSLFFISFTGNQITPGLATNWTVLFLFLSFSVLIGISAGIYPSLYLSSFSPARVLKGTFTPGSLSGQLLKKILTVMQFTFSIIFVITSVILYQQFRYMGDTDYGFNRENVVNIALQDVSFNQLKYDFGQDPDLVSMSASSKVPAMGSIDGAWVDSDSISQKVNAHSFNVDENYLQTMGINLIYGRNFDPELSTDSSSSVIISEEAAIHFGFSSATSALGNLIKVNDNEMTVIGVIEGFLSADPMRSGDPIVMMFRPDHARYAIVRTQPGKTADFIANLEAAWPKYNSLFSLKYQIFDDQLKENPIILVFTDFIKILSLLGIFSVIISCLGLLGMAMYSAERRVKEIGIRKVLGASTQNIMVMLSREFLILVAIAISIAVPLSWFINNLWMKVVTNKVGLDPFVFVLGTLGVVALAGFTIWTQSYRASRVNAIENLRSE